MLFTITKEIMPKLKSGHSFSRTKNILNRWKKK